MLLEWLPSQVSWALSLLKASCLNHLFLPANLQCSHIQRHLPTAPSERSRLPARPPAATPHATHRKASPPLRFLYVLFPFCPRLLSYPPPSQGLWTFILIFNRNFFSSPASPLWSLIFVWSLCLCKDKDSAPSLSRLLFPLVSLKPSQPLLCPQTGVNLYDFCLARPTIFFSHFLSTFCSFFFPFFCIPALKCQCLTSTSCWLVFTGHQSNGGTRGKDKRRRGGCRGENDDKIYSQYGTVQCLPLRVNVWHFDWNLGKCCMSLNSNWQVTQSLCMVKSLMVKWFAGEILNNDEEPLSLDCSLVDFHSNVNAGKSI